MSALSQALSTRSHAIRVGLLAILMLGALPAAVTVEDRGDFIKIRESDGAVTEQMLYLRKRDVSAVTYSRTGFNEGQVTLVMHYRDAVSEPGGFVMYHIGVPPTASGDTMADKIIRLIEPSRGGQVISRIGED
ncbi:MAG: hypothetical protein PF961_03165 [Planctomycetota bacterium]|jgi:hypothetical protein|nr:hypothetical protein [Planctomycetota bacterium]